VNQSSDQDLLREYARGGSEAAFSELTRRYVDLVYSAALRLVRDSALAEDVSQGVFLALARNCHNLRETARLPGWLHQTTHHLAVNAVRSEARRRAREREAATMNELFSAAHAHDSDWEGLAPQLDNALLELSEVDRDALLRRYFQRQPAREMAHVLGISDVAAQKRVNRAVDRLREVLNRRGLAVGSQVLVGLILANGVQSAPAGLAATISGVAAAGACVPVSKGLVGLKLLFMTTFQKTVLTTAILAASGFGVYEIKHLSTSRPEAARNAPAPSVAVIPAEPQPAPTAVAHAPARRTIPRTLPAPRSRVVPLKNSIPGIPFTQTEMYALLQTKQLNLTLAQVQSFLEANNRNSKSLLAAFRTTRDLSLLTEAAQKYPSDPQVAFEVAIRMGASPAERLPWLDVLRQASADNSLPDYLAAAAHFQSGDQAAAVGDLIAASAKTGYQDYLRERTQGNEEAYLAAGYTIGDAKLFSSIGPAEPHLLTLKELGRDVLGLANTYQQAGDSTSRESALQIAVDLGQRLSDPSTGETLLRQTVGIGIERAALQAMDPDSVFDTAGLTVQGRLNQLTSRIDEIRSFAQQADPLWKTLNDQGWVNYQGQLAANGEEAALRWLIGNRK
jgi:RNA polymerase sigma factor (sigma-70 family)